MALSCKQRAFCPRCVGRKMADQAKHLVENVLPPVPFRQWVLSFPHALRWRGLQPRAHPRRLGHRPSGHRRALPCPRAGSLGPPGQHSSARPGSVMAIQRFGGALNLNVHFHALYTDGSFYERSDGQLVFLHAAPPAVAELATLVADIKRRVVLLLEKLGLGPDEDEDWDAQQLMLSLGEALRRGRLPQGRPAPAQRKAPRTQHVRPTQGARRRL
ncbi:MAG: transposase [Sandaracinaceae bacterium]|nr:transposase [Sandaracinaceae bacterium]